MSVRTSDCVRGKQVARAHRWPAACDRGSREPQPQGTRHFRAGLLVFHVAGRVSSLSNHSLIPTPAMDVDGISSSPPLRHSSLPPSSAPAGSQSSNGHHTPRRGTPQRNRAPIDALNLEDDEAEEADENQEQATRRRRRPRNQQLDGDVPMVKDAVGESVQESFEAFLRT